MGLDISNSSAIKALLAILISIFIGWVSFISVQALAKPDMIDVHTAIKATSPYTEDRKLIERLIQDAREERQQIKGSIDALSREIQQLKGEIRRNP